MELAVGSAVGFVVGPAGGLGMGFADVDAVNASITLIVAKKVAIEEAVPWGHPVNTFGIGVGSAVGFMVRLAVGLEVAGWVVGLTVGQAVGFTVMQTVGLAVGQSAGWAVGLIVGLAVGLVVGLAVGWAA